MWISVKFINFLNSLSGKDYRRNSKNRSATCGMWDLIKHAVKTFDLQINHIKSQQIFQFRLKANPSKRNKESGKLIGMFRQSDQINWLERKGNQCGFTVKGVDVILTPNIFGIKNKGSSPIKIQTVLYQGILQVEDPNLLVEAIRRGIGRGRSYGCGLLSIARMTS